MVHIVDTSNIGEFASQLTQMHQLRYKTFAERLKWEVETAGDMEMDVFDAMSPKYFLKLSPSGHVRGCLRMLPTTGPYMLKDVFPVLLGGQSAPADPAVFEISRFAVDGDGRPDARSAGISRTTYELFIAIIEFGLDIGLTEYVGVVDNRMEVIVRRSGLVWNRIGESYQIGSTQAVAGITEVSEASLARVRERSGIKQRVLQTPARIDEAA